MFMSNTLMISLEQIFFAIIIFRHTIEAGHEYLWTHRDHYDAMLFILTITRCSICIK